MNDKRLGVKRFFGNITEKMCTKTILTFLCCLTIFFYDILTFSLRPYVQSSMNFFRVIYPFALQDRNLKVRNNKQHYSLPKVIYKTKRFDGPLEKTPENKNLELLRNTIPYERSLNSLNTNIITNRMSFERLYKDTWQFWYLWAPALLR